MFGRRKLNEAVMCADGFKMSVQANSTLLTVNHAKMGQA